MPTWSSLERLGALLVICVSTHVSMPFVVCCRSDNSSNSPRTHAKLAALAIDNAVIQIAHYQSPDRTKGP